MRGPGPRGGDWADNDLDILAKRHEEAHQPLERELPKVALEHFGDVGLLDAETPCRGGLSELLLLHHSRDLADELGLKGELVGDGTIAERETARANITFDT